MVVHTIHNRRSSAYLCIVFGHHLSALIFGPTPLDNLQQNLMICLVRKENKFWYLCIHYILWITFIYKVDWKFIFSFTNFLGHSYCNCIHRNCIFSFGLSYFTIAWEKSQLIFSVLVFW